MSNNQMQEPIIIGGEMIPHPSFYHDATKMHESTGFEKSEHPTANQELLTPTGGSEMVVQQQPCSQEAVTEGSDWQSIAPIRVDPISSFNPEQGNRSSTKRKKGTAYVTLELLERDFTLGELFKSNNIEELNQGSDSGERTLDPEELLKNLKGWKIERRRRLENNRNGKIDKIYHHPNSKRILRSLVGVKKFVEENSYVRNASDNDEGSSRHPNVNFFSSSGEVFQEFPRINP